jgi:hypothetical protein
MEGGKGVSINRDNEDTYNALLHGRTDHLKWRIYAQRDMPIHSYHYSTRTSNNKYTDVQTDPTYYRNKRVDGPTPHRRGRFVLAEGPHCLLSSS